MIKISIIYFIQIRQTDDFPSTGTRLVCNNPQCVSHRIDARRIVGKYKRWTFSDSADKGARFVTLPYVVSAVCIAPN